MLRRVLIFGTITAPHMAACEADAQIHPGIPRLDAVLANRDVLWMHITNLVFMGACLIGHMKLL
jgi:hypothetical protein